MIADLRADGMSDHLILSTMGYAYSDRLIWHLMGGTQPLHWRGEQLVALWCERMRKERDQVPTCNLVRGHRVAKRVEQNKAPKAVSLPQWPKNQRKTLHLPKQKARA